MRTRNHILPLTAAVGVLATSAQAATNIEGVADFTLSSSSTAGATHDNLPAAFQAQLAPGVITSTASSNLGASYPESALTDGSLATGGANAWASASAASVTLTLDFASADVAGVILNWGWGNRTPGDYQVLVDGNSLGSIRVDTGGGVQQTESNEPNTYIIFDSVQSGATKIEVITSNGAFDADLWGLDEIEVYTGTAGPDNTPPSISSLSPADDTADVAVDTAFVATFSEPIALTATGTITVTDGSDTRVVNLDGSADDGDASVLNDVLTITLDTDLTNNLSSYDVLISNDAIVDTAPAMNPFAGTVAGDWNFTTAAVDLTAPTIVPPTDPADDSTGVAVGSDFVATFSEPIALTATGTITVTDGSETRVVNLDGSADDGNASVLGDVLTITLDADLTNILSSYDILISNDAIVDTAPAMNPFAGTVAGDWNFTTAPNAAPVTLQNATADHSQSFGGQIAATIDGSFAGNNGWAFHPNMANDHTAVYETQADLEQSNVTFTLSQLFTSTDSMTLRKVRLSVTQDDRSTFADGLANGGDVTANWTVLTPLTAATNNGGTATINGDGTIDFPNDDPIDGNTTTIYTVTATTPFGAITGFRLEVFGPCGYGGGDNAVLTEFEVDAAAAGPDNTPPLISSLSPADDTADVAVDTAFVATFSENIALTATGTITVTDGSDTRVVNLDGSADDGDASVLSNVLTITLDTDLTNNLSSYDVLISNDAIVDTAPAMNPFAGTVAGDWNFTTAAVDLTAPTIVPPTDPADDSTGVAVFSDFVATFSEPIALTATGTITVTDGSETRVVNLDGSADDGDASVLGDVLTITLDTDLTNLLSSYDILISNDAIVDTAPAMNPFAGTVAGDWNFTTGTVGTWSSSPWADDADLTAYLSGSATYTHAIDFEGGTEGTQSSATIAGVSFTQYEFTNWNNVARNGTDLGTGKAWSYTQTNQAYNGNAASGPSGTESDKLSTGFLGAAAGQTETLTLEGLDAHTDYVITLYNAKWDTNTRTASLDGLDDGVGNARVTDPDNTFVSYAYNTGASTSFSMNITGTGVNEYNIYAFTNQLVTTAGNDFSDWIAGYSVGGQTGINDDPDGDGVDSGVENFFGTAPDTFSQGLVSSAADTGAGTFTFTHPQTGTLADDLTATYQWSVDLANFFADGVADGGVQVDFVATPDSPSPGTTTVVATVTGPVPAKLFVNVEVTQD